MANELERLQAENDHLRHLAHKKRNRPWSLLFLAFMALIMAGTVLYAQYYFSKRADNALCGTLITLVERSSSSLRDHPYYDRHPEELDEALAENRRTLADLRNACPE